MLTIHIGSYGLGFIINKVGDDLTFAHGGDSRGYHNYMYYNISKDEGVVIMTNGQNGSYLYPEILRSLAMVYNWPSLKPRIIDPINMDNKMLQKLCGNYVFNDLIQTSVSIHNDRLKMVGTDGRSFDLYPISEHIYIDKNSGWEVHFCQNEADEVQNASVFVNGIELKGVKLEI